MADVTVTSVPILTGDPVTDAAPTDKLEMNYIFYPGISATYTLNLKNTTQQSKTLAMYFDGTTMDDKWFRTLRFVDGQELTTTKNLTLEPSETRSIQVNSLTTKEGFSGLYDGSHWTNSGFSISDMNTINNGDEVTASIDVSAAPSGSTLTLDAGEPVEFHRVKVSTLGYVNFTGRLQYSDDDVQYTDLTLPSGYTLGILGDRKQATYWWDDVDEHQYWRIEKTSPAAGSGTINEVQWLRFEAHKDAYDYGVYGDHSATLKDSNGLMEDFDITTSIQISTDVFSRQNWMKPIGKVGPHTKAMTEQLNRWGHNVQLWYYPTCTFSYDLTTKEDFPLEARVWNTKALIAPQKRNLQYTAAADGLQPSLYRYDQRDIFLPAFGPDFVGWYMTNYDFWHAYGHSWYVIWDNHCYKIDDPQPAYIDDEIVGITARFFLQSDMFTISPDPRSYIIANSQGVYAQWPSDQNSLPKRFVDTDTPEQCTTRWVGAVPTWVFSRQRHCRPNTYELVPKNVIGEGGSLDFIGEVYDTEEWINPATTQFTTAVPLAFGVNIRNQTANALAYQMDRFYRWPGFCDFDSGVDVIGFILQVYADEDCLIPVTLATQNTSTLAKVERRINRFDWFTTDGKITLRELGPTCFIDGHESPTPKKLYVRYLSDDTRTDYYLS